MTLLELEEVSAGYGDIPAVTSLSLSVDQGEILALVGANGAGKSTLLRTIAGAHTPWTGRVLFDGIDITSLPDYKRAHLGISLVPEGRLLFPSLTVRENLAIGASPKRAGDWNLDSVLDALPMLRPLVNRSSSRLSGGQQQAVAIGRALMANPSLLLLDEVSLGLAPVVVDEIYQTVERLRHGGFGVILVEQDLARATNTAHRVICMLEGHKVLEGPTSTLSRQTITDAYFGHALAGFGNETAPAERGNQ